MINAMSPWTACAPRLFGYLFARRRDASSAVPKLWAFAAANICFASGSFWAGSTNFSGGGSLLSKRLIDGSAAKPTMPARPALTIRARNHDFIRERVQIHLHG